MGGTKNTPDVPLVDQLRYARDGALKAFEDGALTACRVCQS